jgi:hypothetical protein
MMTGANASAQGNVIHDPAHRTQIAPMVRGGPSGRTTLALRLAVSLPALNCPARPTGLRFSTSRRRDELAYSLVGRTEMANATSGLPAAVPVHTLVNERQ